MPLLLALAASTPAFAAGRRARAAARAAAPCAARAHDVARRPARRRRRPAKDDEGPPRLSLPTESDRDAWLRSGFRLSLGLVYGRLAGLEGAPSGRLLGATLRLGLRLDADWSRARVVSVRERVGARRPVGAAVRGHDRSDVARDARTSRSRSASASAASSRGAPAGPTSTRCPTRSRPRTRFPARRRRCRAAAASARPALARAEWTFVLGPRSATSLGLEAIGQWTGCVDDTGRVEPDTGQAIVRRQYWPHVGATGTWGFTWR